jgi:hypothetical protein
VGLKAYRAVAHRTGAEPLDDLADRLDLVDGHRGPAGLVTRRELEEAAKRHQPFRLLVDP